MRFKKFLPFFVIVLLIVVFFWQFFLKGLAPIPSDIIVGMYYPWLDEKWGYVVGVPVKNNLLSDSVSQFWIWRNLAIDLLGQNRVLFGTPMPFLGLP